MKPSGTITPPLIPTIKMPPKMSSWGCHVEVKSIGCNQERRQACALQEQVTFALFLFLSFQPLSAPCFIPHFCLLTFALSFFSLLTDYTGCTVETISSYSSLSSVALWHYYIFITTINTSGTMVGCFHIQIRTEAKTVSLAHITVIHTAAFRVMFVGQRYGPASH